MTLVTPGTAVQEFLAAFEAPGARVGHLLCDRHPDDAIAFTFVDADLSSRDVTFGELGERSRRLAAAFTARGIGPGDRVATLLGPSADLVTTLLAIWRVGAVHVPLFTAFAPAAIAARTLDGRTKMIVCSPGERHKLQPGPDMPADPPWEIVVTLDGLIRAHDPQPEPCAAGADAPFIELYTSGTTGAPKGVEIPVRALASFCSYQVYGLDHRDDDIYWNVGDPGWGYGLFFGITAPLALGRRSLLVGAGFSPDLAWQVLTRYGVTNLAGAPTFYRSLREAGRPPSADPRLRCCSAGGEPLGADVARWAEEELGATIRDHYGQTELGMVTADAWHPDVRSDPTPGSMGSALPGFSVAVLDDERDHPAPDGTPGRLAVDRAASPLFWFTGYAGRPEATAERFDPSGRWYLTGDRATRDAEGNLFFHGRDDDVIITAGYRVGPHDIEHTLLRHPEVAEAAVVGAPDELRGQIIEAYVVPRGDRRDALRTELRELVRHRYARHAYPRAVHFVPELPKTPSGKIQRGVLRRRSARP
jgi:acetyl-CoA synthetase